MEIKLEGLTKVFTDLKAKTETRAVSNLDIVIPSGKLVGLLGPSGCGKSTTLYMISGLLYPTEGRIFFGDEDVTELSPEKRGIGLVFQNYALYPHMTVRKNILFPLENMNIRKRSIEEAYKKAHLIETPNEAKTLYAYEDRSESLKNKYRRHESELKAQYQSAKLAFEKEFKEAQVKTPELKQALKNNLENLKLDLDNKVKEFENKYLEEKAKITPANLKELKDIIHTTYAKVEKEFETKAKAIKKELSGAHANKNELQAKYEIEIEKIMPESVSIVKKAKAINYKKQMNDDAVAMAKLVGIEDQLDKTPAQLSSGQQQHVAIARALVKKPRVLLLDEPLSNLDARLRLQTREEIKRIQRETGITTVFVTHDQEEAMSISDEIMLMNFGEEQQTGVPQEVYDEPENLFVASFLGTPPIGLYDVELKGGKVYLDDTVIFESKKLAKEKDRKVVMGVRPEGYEPNPNGKVKLNRLFVETIGRDLSIVATHENARTESFRVIISAKNIKLGEQDVVAFDLDPNKTYIFDEEDGRRLA